MSARLSLARAEGLVPPGPVAVFRPGVAADLSGFDPAVTQVVTGDRVAWRHWAARGYEPVLQAQGPLEGAVVCVTRAKAYARSLIAEAVSKAGRALVDGQKVDGVESLLKEVRARGGLGAVIAKAHGKLFEVSGDFSDWLLPEVSDAGPWQTSFAGFSADGPDPGSEALAAVLPPLSGVVWDLGAGWGYLSARVLAASPKVSELALVESEHSALEAARGNITDPRARFHWLDALAEAPEGRPDHIIMNPPFHTGRKADPDLGRAFIARAARVLPRHGVLWMVANRHLPYEPALAASFAEIEEIGGDARFKLTRARRPITGLSGRSGRG